MEDLIESYLFKNKKCPLPSLGVLQLMDTSAIASYAEGKIEAPVPTIKLIDTTMHAGDFISYIAFKKNISTAEASALLKQYCDGLENMHAFSETRLPHAGKFYVNADGGIIFKSMEISPAFSPSVKAHRVIHPDASHSMVVGDKETTSTEMAAYYSETEEASKSRWWIWALSFAVIAAAAIFFYINEGQSGQFGNAQPIHAASEPVSYHVAE